MPTDSSTELRLLGENAELRARLAKAEETLRAIRGGEVDLPVVQSSADQRRHDEFLAKLAHEFRNPLAAVRNGVYLLQTTGQAMPELQPTVDIIDRQTQQLAWLIDDLMDLSRISLGKIQLKREHAELTKVVMAAVEKSRPIMKGLDHELALTPLPIPVVVDADVTWLARVFLNLLTNAANHTHPGGRIELRVEQELSDVVVSVKDTGIGISADQLPAIFQVFPPVEGASSSGGGLGLGLCLVKRLVEMHNGRVEAHSEGLGKGSEFVVRLPIVVEQT